MENTAFLRMQESIRAHIDGLSCTTDDIGLSGSTVVLFEDMVLKIEPHSAKVDGAVEMMHWLTGRLPIPQVIEYAVENGLSYLLMTRIPGEMCCSPYYMAHSDEMVGLMAEGLRMLWDIDTAGCPRERTLQADLNAALQRIRNGRLSPDELSECGFETAEAMACWLEAHPVPYEPVLSHGDYCLPNLLLQDGQISGYIDIGGIGIADRYSDIVDCWNSLKNNFGGVFGGPVYPDFDPDILFEKLGITIDPEKFRYCRLIEKALS
ncbi:MAG: aminoglycoside 3'-phosphotransferase [Clostridia bacterium]|nr:aminoglycoside 3'-phosphotransferase [Clostridia bacterium]